MIKPKISILLYKRRPKGDGTYPLAIVISKHGTRKYIFTKHNLREDQWDPTLCEVKRNHPKSLHLNELLKKEVAVAAEIII